MVRPIILSFVLILFISSVVNAKGWQKIPPTEFPSLKTQLEPALTSYLGQRVTVPRIRAAFENNFGPDNLQFVIFANVKVNGVTQFYFIKAFIGIIGSLLVSEAIQI